MLAFGPVTWNGGGEPPADVSTYVPLAWIVGASVFTQPATNTMASAHESFVIDKAACIWVLRERATRSLGGGDEQFFRIVGRTEAICPPGKIPLREHRRRDVPGVFEPSVAGH